MLLDFSNSRLFPSCFHFFLHSSSQPVLKAQWICGKLIIMFLFLSLCFITVPSHSFAPDSYSACFCLRETLAQHCSACEHSGMVTGLMLGFIVLVPNCHLDATLYQDNGGGNMVFMPPHPKYV